MEPQQEFKIKVINVRNVGEKGWTLAKAVVDGEEDVIGFVGVQDSDDPIESGATYRVIGARNNHPQWGDQVKFTSYILSTPGGRTGVIKYLQQARGIGPATAEAMWAKYRDCAIEYVRDESRHGMIFRQVPVDMETLSMAKTKFDELAESGVEGVLVDLMELTDRIGFPGRLIKEVIKDHGTKAAEWVRENPFRLMGYSGAGFSRCDTLYMREGGEPRRIRRHMYGIQHSIEFESRTGHIWHEYGAVKRSMRAKIVNMRMELGIKMGIKTGLLETKSIDGVVYVALKRLADAELYVANDLAARVEHSRATWGEYEADDLSEHQAEQITKATSRRVGVLVGGPGTGKTFTLAEVLKQIPTDPNKTAICCPTGKAARRAKEALDQAGVTGTKPKTIHSTLGARMEKGSFTFRYGLTEKLPHQYVVVDEMSMCDLELFACLLKALSPTCHLLMIGDHNQLLPVGPGAPLRDIINAPAIPTGELTEVRRNSGQIVRFCHSIREKGLPEMSKFINEEQGENLVLIRCRTEEEQQREIANILEEVAADGFHPIDDVFVITPLNKAGLVSRQPLNDSLQLFLNNNPDGRVRPNPLLVGDPVVCTRNQEVIAVRERKPGVFVKSGSKLVVNGEDAKVCHVAKTVTIAELDDGTLVKIHHKNNGSAVDWTMAYARTAHKAQGSEAPIAIVVVDGSPAGKMVSTAEWIYTAASRATRRCYLVGNNRVLTQMCGNKTIHKRRTDLVGEIDRALRSVSV